MDSSSVKCVAKLSNHVNENWWPAAYVRREEFAE